MDQTIVQRHLSEVPSVIINATHPFGDAKCWAVFIALLQRDDGMRFNQIKELFGAESSEISRVLKTLANAGLIAKHARESESIGSTGASYYVPTTLGKRMITALYRGLLPSESRASSHGTGRPGDLWEITSAGTRYDTATDASADLVAEDGGCSAWSTKPGGKR